MPFISSSKARDLFIVDYDCSFVDDYLRVSEYFFDMTIEFTKFQKYMDILRPVIYFLIAIALVSIGKLRQKPNTKLFLIYAVFRLLKELEMRIPENFKLKHSLIVFNTLFDVSAYVWLAISSYDYMINIR